MNRICRLALPMLCLLALTRTSPGQPAPAPPGGTRLADSTTVDRWTLPNGLEVVVRHVPRARAVSVTWGYRIGLDADPTDRPGWAWLLAEVAFTAPAGDTPERTREEMEDLRPLGWSLRVARRHTLFTEAAPPAQLAGLLHQITQRMRGVTVTAANLRRSLATVRATLEERSRGVTGPALDWQLRELARGVAPGELARRAGARELGRVKPEEVGQALARAYVPANGVLVLAGDFSGLDLRAILAAQFGGLPAGAPPPEPTASPLTATEVVVERPGVSGPVGVVGLFAPALDDTTHPSFYLAMLALGAQARERWEAPAPPLETRFQYPVLDDPGFVRFYPALGPADPRSPGAGLDTLVMEAAETTVAFAALAALRRTVLWLLGGELPLPLLEEMRTQPAALNLLGATTAARTLWGSEAFWSEYRGRLEDYDSAKTARWQRRLRDPRQRASLTVVPPR